MSNILVKGVMPAMITPLDENGKVIFGSIGKNMDRNYSQGASGFYICGSTGEGPVLTAKQRMETAEAVVGANASRGIIVDHVGASSTEEAFMLARHAREIGCDAVSSVVPNFYYKYTEDEIVDYYKKLAYEAGIPVIAYAQGLLTGDVVSLMKKLIGVEGVIGVKFTLTDFYSLHRIKELNNGDINVINGPDEMFICGLAMGADAGIGSTYNLMCAEYKKLFDEFGNGELENAKQRQYKINKVVEVLIKYGVIRSIKYVLTYLGIDSGVSAFPQKTLTEEEKKGLISELDKLGYFDKYNSDL